MGSGRPPGYRRAKFMIAGGNNTQLIREVMSGRDDAKRKVGGKGRVQPAGKRNTPVITFTSQVRRGNNRRPQAKGENLDKPSDRA